MKLYTLEEVKKAIRRCDYEHELIILFCDFIENTEYFNPEQQDEITEAYHKRISQIQYNDNDV